MKVIRLTTLLDFGGQERQYISFTNQPSNLKNQYIFAALGNGGYASNLLIERGFQVKIFNLNTSIKNLKNIWVLYKWFLKEKPDIVHTAAAEANFHGIIAAKLAGVPIIYAEEIGLPNHSFKARMIFNFLYRKINNVICVSFAVKEYLIQIGELDRNKGIVLYNPVSEPQKRHKIPSDRFEMVYVGRLEEVKNVVFLIKAIGKLPSKERFFLTIVGEGRTRAVIEKLVLSLGLQSSVKLVGFSGTPENYVSQADLFVLPSLSEGFGIAVVEAMFQGVPCLCSNVGGIPEFIEDGINGWLFEPTNEKTLLDKLKNIMDLSTENLNSIGQRGYDSVIDKFTTMNYIKKLENIYFGKN